MILKVGADGENHIRVGKLNLVDLAGSERQTKTGAAVKLFFFLDFHDSVLIIKKI